MKRKTSEERTEVQGVQERPLENASQDHVVGLDALAGLDKTHKRHNLAFTIRSLQGENKTIRSERTTRRQVVVEQAVTPRSEEGEARALTDSQSAQEPRIGIRIRCSFGEPWRRDLARRESRCRARGRGGSSARRATPSPSLQSPKQQIIRKEKAIKTNASNLVFDLEDSRPEGITGEGGRGEDGQLIEIIHGSELKDDILRFL